LRERLLNRGTETEKSLHTRLSNAESELEKAVSSQLFDRFLVNDDKDVFLEEAREYLTDLYQL